MSATFSHARRDGFIPRSCLLLNFVKRLLRAEWQLGRLLRAEWQLERLLRAEWQLEASMGISGIIFQ